MQKKMQNFMDNAICFADFHTRKGNNINQVEFVITAFNNIVINGIGLLQFNGNTFLEKKNCTNEMTRHID
jgi:hypothetical protein